MGALVKADCNVPDAPLEGALLKNDRLVPELPTEVLTQILSRVHATKGNEVVWCMEVCKHWGEAAKLVVTGLRLAESFSPQSALAGIAQFPNLGCLRIEECTSSTPGWAAAFKVVGNSCQKLKYLCISKVLPGLVYTDTASIFHHCTHLRTLAITASLNCKKLPPVARLTALETLSLSEHGELQDLPPLDNLVALRHLILVDNRRLRLLPSLAQNIALRMLNVSGCSELLGLPPLDTLTNLELLNVSDCDSIMTLNLPSLPALDHLEMQNTARRTVHFVRDLHGLDLNPQITTLGVNLPLAEMQCLANVTCLTITLNDSDEYQLVTFGFRHLRRLSLMAVGPVGTLYLPELVEFDFSSWGARALPKLVGMSSILSINIQHGEFLTSLAELRKVTILRRLTLTNFSSIAGLPSLDGLTTLSHLSIDGCDWRAPLPALTPLRHLTHLSVFGCSRAKVLPLLDGLTSLCHLSCGRSGFLRLPPLAHLTSLTTLVLSVSQSVVEIPKLPANLAELVIEQFEALQKLPSLESLAQLGVLRLVGNKELGGLPSLAGLAALEKLIVRDCAALTGMPSMDSLTSLRRFDLVGCPRVAALPSFKGLFHLRALNVPGYAVGGKVA